MVKRYNVSVSDELAERIDSWKDKISPSAVFQGAMEKAIDSEERFQNRVKGNDMTAIIERLKQEKQEAEGDYRDQGKGYGLEWAKDARYRDLRRVVSTKIEIERFYDQWGRIGGEYIYADDAIVDDGVREAFNANPILGETSEMHGITGHYLSTEASEWLMGFLEGVQAFWDEVEDKL